MFRKGVNPHTAYKGYKERGREKFYYTYEDLSRITGLKVETLYLYRAWGYFDIEDLESMILFIAEKIKQKKRVELKKRLKGLEARKFLPLMPFSQKLTSREREILEMRYNRGKSWVEIGEAFRLTQLQAKRTADMAIKKLKRSIWLEQMAISL